MKPRRPRRLIAPGMACIWVAGFCAAAATGLQRDVVLTSPAPLARNGELLRRLVSPLHAMDMRLAVAGDPRALEASPLAPAQQHFALYVPTSPAPAAGLRAAGVRAALARCAGTRGMGPGAGSK